MDPAIIRAGVATLRTQEVTAQANLQLFREGITTFQRLCGHPNREDKGHDPRGSGADDYACPDCLKEWRE